MQTMKIVKIIAILALPAVAAVFIYQNTAVAQLTFLFWSVAMSTSLMVLAVFLAGFLTGILLILLGFRIKSSPVKAVNKP
jgi:uncharacterized integral membrane protein